jgi:hypothetical protein
MALPALLGPLSAAAPPKPVKAKMIRQYMMGEMLGEGACGY